MCGADTVHLCLQILSFQDVGGSKTSLIKADGTPRKKGKKKKAKKASKGQGVPDNLGESYLASELQDIREDVVGLDAKGEEEEEKRQPPFVTSAPILQSQPIDKLFIETNSTYSGSSSSDVIGPHLSLRI